AGPATAGAAAGPAPAGAAARRSGRPQRREPLLQLRALRTVSLPPREGEESTRLDQCGEPAGAALVEDRPGPDVPGMACEGTLPPSLTPPQFKPSVPPPAPPAESPAMPPAPPSSTKRSPPFKSQCTPPPSAKRVKPATPGAAGNRVDHPARRLLKFYKQRGAPAKMSTPPWSKEQVDAALQRGAHKSCMDYLGFLEGEFADMIAKAQWVVLPESSVRDLPGLRISPPGCVPQEGRRPRWIVDYTWSLVNNETLPLAPKEAMQFGQALDRVLREILLADPKFGPVELMKVDLSDGFYRVNLNIDDIPKLGVVFPTRPRGGAVGRPPVSAADGVEEQSPYLLRSHGDGRRHGQQEDQR
ncbi:hypothetical protein THAOC_00941, partial [Thalassiosira oceanica]